MCTVCCGNEGSRGRHTTVRSNRGNRITAVHLASSQHTPLVINNTSLANTVDLLISSLFKGNLVYSCNQRKTKGYDFNVLKWFKVTIIFLKYYVKFFHRYKFASFYCQVIHQCSKAPPLVSSAQRKCWDALTYTAYHNVLYLLYKWQKYKHVLYLCPKPIHSIGTGPHQGI